MEHSFSVSGISGKKEQYEEFLKMYSGLIEEEHDVTALLANTAAALHDAFGFFWVGFYMVKEDRLVLGPFQGSVACYRIA